jgi:hypothetical protein
MGKTFCKKHERFYEGACEYCVPGQPVTVGVDAAKVFENMKVPYSGPARRRTVDGHLPSCGTSYRGCDPACCFEQRAARMPVLPSAPAMFTADRKEPYEPTDPCQCGALTMNGIDDVLSHVRHAGSNHRRDKCWTPAPFPFHPLPEPGSPEALEEMQRSVPSSVSPENNLVRMLNGRRSGKSELQRQMEANQTAPQYSKDESGVVHLKGRFNFDALQPIVVDEVDSFGSVERAMKAVMSQIERRYNELYWKPTPPADPHEHNPVIKAMRSVDGGHDPSTCRICQALGRAPQPQPRQLDIPVHPRTFAAIERAMVGRTLQGASAGVSYFARWDYYDGKCVQGLRVEDEHGHINVFPDPAATGSAFDSLIQALIPALRGGGAT